jgi:hypothetical protein
MDAASIRLTWTFIADLGSDRVVGDKGSLGWRIVPKRTDGIRAREDGTKGA